MEVHAVTFWNLVQHNSLWRMPLGVETLLIIALGIALGYALSFFKPPAATGIACLFAVVIALVNFLAFTRFHLWFPWLIPALAQAPVALGWAYFFQAFNSYVELKLLESSLELFVSPRQVRRILKQP